MEPNLVTKLAILESQINATIDDLIKLRDSCQPNDKATYRYACRKIEQALTKVQEAQEKINYSKVDFTLDD